MLSFIKPPSFKKQKQEENNKKHKRYVHCTTFQSPLAIQ